MKKGELIATADILANCEGSALAPGPVEASKYVPRLSVGSIPDQRSDSGASRPVDVVTTLLRPPSHGSIPHNASVLDRVDAEIAACRGFHRPRKCIKRLLFLTHIPLWCLVSVQSVLQQYFH